MSLLLFFFFLLGNEPQMTQVAYHNCLQAHLIEILEWKEQKQSNAKHTTKCTKTEERLKFSLDQCRREPGPVQKAVYSVLQYIMNQVLC